MLTGEELSARRELIRASPDLSALLNRLGERAQPVLQRMPVVPSAKALLSVDGGVCPDDGTRLEFDPWNPTSHRCSRCGKRFTGERHDRAWAHYQHLWVSERAAHLATLAVLGDRAEAASRAGELLRAYAGYLQYPNSDNVLGPSRLFFSTYLESVWIGNYLAAATLLREAGMLDEATGAVVSTVADEAANLIGDYDEGLSNRQTWHNAALAAIAVWFEDEELGARAVEGSSGIVTHLVRGFGDDGMWYEGDNYHLFALRGQLLAMRWAGQAGVDLLADEKLARRLGRALRAPAISALPDATFPARKDSRFGVSLAQPMYLELWEIGLARLAGAGGGQEELWSWLRQLYDSPAPPAQTFDSYLHEAGESPPKAQRSRSDLSWWSLIEMAPALPAAAPAWSPGSTFIEGQGLAVLRSGDRYASLESGGFGGGHGHPDRLNLVLHADGEYWLPDFGTGSYVARDLFWYRSTLAHNAPRLNGVSQPYGDAVCDNFDAGAAWSWVRGRYGEMNRALVAGPGYLLDVLELSSTDEAMLELPWHLGGRVELETRGRWEPGELRDEFVSRVERFVPDKDVAASIVLRAHEANATLGLHLAFEGELLRALAPGAPGTGHQPFYLVRARGKNLRFVSVLEPTRGAPLVSGLRVSGGAIAVETTAGTDQHTATAEGWEIQTGDETVRLRGGRRIPPPFVPTVITERPLVMQAVALPIADPPALDGSLEGFDTAEPLTLDHEDQYRRSEEPYSGPEEFSAVAYVNWDGHELYLAVDVTKPEVLPRNPRSPPLRLDNEPDEIHADGIQVYFESPMDETVYGFLIAPSTETGAIVVRPVSGMAADESMVRGGWEPTDAGYTLTVGITPPDWDQLRPGEEIPFDLLINQMLPGRQRRAGQLVWSGGGGWVWLRGDRQDRSRFGILELR